MPEAATAGAGGAGAGAGTAEGQPQPWEGARSIEEAELLTPAAAKPAEEGSLADEEDEDNLEGGGAPPAKKPKAKAKPPAASAAKPGEKPAAVKPEGEGEGEPPEESEEDEIEEGEEEGEGEGEGEPAFDPKAHGLDPQAYANCKTLGEALALAERRRKDQESRADRQAGELGLTRKRLAEIEQEHQAAEQAAAKTAGQEVGAGAPVEWTPEDKQRVIEEFEQNPQNVVAWIQAPLLKRIEALEKQQGDLTERQQSAEVAPYTVQAAQEWDSFVGAHPDAAELYKSGTLDRIGTVLNAGVPDDRQRWDYATVYGLAKAETERPGDFGRLVELVRMGHSLEEASAILENALRAKELEKTKRLNAAEQVKRKRGLAGGAGGPASGPETVTAIGIQNL